MAPVLDGAVSAAACSGDAQLDTLIDPLLSGLAGCVHGDRGLWDPLLDQPSPMDHYGHLAAGLAFALAGDGFREAHQRAFAAWQRAPERDLGHLPFNRLLLLLHRECGELEPGSDAIDHALKRCRLSRSYPSNNWMLLAQLCRLIEAPSGRHRAKAVRRYCRMLDAWSTPSGGFIDFPRRPKAGIGSTPVAYHCKALLLTVFAAWFHDSPELGDRVQRLLSWINLAWDGGGYVGGFGRSTHALYGDACLVAALVLLGVRPAVDGSQAGERLLAGVLSRLRAQVRPDGLLWLNPAGAEHGDQGWDGYMVLSVYNSWFAAVVGWARWRVAAASSLPGCLEGISLPENTSGVMQDAAAGLIRVSAASGLTGLVSTRGQPPQAFSRSEVELRYAGGMPYHLSMNGSPLCAPPIRLAVEQLLEMPVLAGWVPVFRAGERLYGLVDFPFVTVEEHADAVLLRMKGSPMALNADSSRPWSRLQAALDWRFLDGRLGRRRALGRDRLRGVSATLVFRFPRRSLALEMLLQLEVRETDQELVYVNPCGHALLEDVRPAERVLTRKMPGGSWEEVNTGEQICMAASGALPHGVVCCLPPLKLATGGAEFGVKLAWPA